MDKRLGTLKSGIKRLAELYESLELSSNLFKTKEQEEVVRCQMQ